MTDEEVSLLQRELLGKLGKILHEHGPMNEHARQFILAHAHVPDFRSLGTTLVFLHAAHVRRKRERELLGKGPECEACMGDGSVGILPCEACDGTGDAPEVGG